MNGRFIHIAGSAHQDCTSELLDLAHLFVQHFTRAVLDSGGGLIIFASNEPLRADSRPLTFDWGVLDAISAWRNAHPYAKAVLKVVTAPKSLTDRIPPARRIQLDELCGAGIAEYKNIHDDLYTGGTFRDLIAQESDGLLLIGGGKGVFDLSYRFQKRGAPVLPLGIELGAISNDGPGAEKLFAEALAAPDRFFPIQQDDFRKSLPVFSLSGGPDAVPDLAARAVGLLQEEIEARAIASAPVVAILTILPVELSAVRSALGMTAESKQIPSGTHYWDLIVDRPGRVSFRAVLACAGFAGNPDAAAATTELLLQFSPKALLVVGIAAGVRGKCKLGEVAVSERVWSYEPAAVVTDDHGRSSSVPRPDSFRVAHGIHQDFTTYLSEAPESRLAITANEQGISFPDDHPNVTPRPSVRLSTIASGEKLLRDPSKLAGLRKDQQGKIEAGEMEAVGVATACEKQNVPFLVFRGISDFGDSKKDDSFHELASRAASIVAVDFLRYALTLVDDASNSSS